MSMTTDVRLEPATWDPCVGAADRDRRIRALLVVNVVLALWYFSWLLQPSRIGHPVLYALLVLAEVFNLAQAAGFWWTCASARTRRPRGPAMPVAVDVLVPTYNEPVAIVEPALRAAARIRGYDVRVHLLDDGGRTEMADLAARVGADYITRPDRTGAKAGAINNALRRTDAPYVAVFDCDHIPDERFLECTLAGFGDDRVAIVQTPQYYANADKGVAAASWAQQALFFGPIARGKDGAQAMFCCGTNMVFRRAALDQVGGFPIASETEDFELSLRLAEEGWTIAYVAEVLARGLAPEDMASYTTQQFRWARGCISALPRIIRAKLPAKTKLHYALSSMFFLSGWTLLIYMLMPILRLAVGVQPIDAATSNTFLLHFAPYFLAAIATVALAGGGTYTFQAFALVSATFWVHIAASIAAALRIGGGFRVTPKVGRSGRQLSTVIPTLVAVLALLAAAGYGLVQDRSPGTLNNVGFACLHVTVLLTGAWPALVRSR